jgi:hypothetical protein
VPSKIACVADWTIAIFSACVMCLSVKKNHGTLKPDNGSRQRRFDDSTCGSWSSRFAMQLVAAQPGRRLLSMEGEAAVAADAVRYMGALSGHGPSELYFMSVEFTLTYIQYVHFSSHATVTAKDY